MKTIWLGKQKKPYFRNYCRTHSYANAPNNDWSAEQRPGGSFGGALAFDLALLQLYNHCLEYPLPHWDEPPGCWGFAGRRVPVRGAGGLLG